MALTYEPIATTTLSSATTTITFSSIPSSYTDLRIVIVPKISNGTGWTTLQFNGDTGTNYSVTYITGNGSTASSSRLTSQSNIYVGYNSNASAGYTFNTVDVFSYTGSTFKTVLNTNSDDQNGSGFVRRIVGLWRNTNAITSIELKNSQFNADTTATLYGIKAA